MYIYVQPCTTPILTTDNCVCNKVYNKHQSPFTFFHPAISITQQHCRGGYNHGPFCNVH